MTGPIEELDILTARGASRLVAAQVIRSGDDISWDWRLLPSRSNTPLAVTAFRSTASEPISNLETAINLSLNKVGLKLRGAPYKRSSSDSRITLSYYVRSI
jgi:hypothetical protein